MWQKLKRLDVVNLEKARIQIINVLQLVSAPPRLFIRDKINAYLDWLSWEPETSSFVSNKFGENHEINISLDIERFILSINGKKDQKEHLVLSGMTYPMAYGWMNIKLETFQLDISKFNDEAPYQLERYIKPDEELNSEDQETYDQIVIHYCNAHDLLAELKMKLNIDEQIRIDPATANMVLTQEPDNLPQFGFSLGSKRFPEPYYYFKIDASKLPSNSDKEDFSGIWSPTQSEFVLMASDFLNQNQDLEFQKVMAFFKENYAKLAGS